MDMWTKLFLWFWVLCIGSALLYMAVTLKSVPFSIFGGDYEVYSLMHDPVGYIIAVSSLGCFEWFLLKVLLYVDDDSPSQKSAKKS